MIPSHNLNELLLYCSPQYHHYQICKLYRHHRFLKLLTFLANDKQEPPMQDKEIRQAVVIQDGLNLSRAKLFHQSLYTQDLGNF